MDRAHEQVRVTGTITADHKLVADVPDNLPPGEVEVVIHPALAPSINELKAWIARLATSGHKGTDPAELDRQIEAQRDSWER